MKSTPTLASTSNSKEVLLKIKKRIVFVNFSNGHMLLQRVSETIVGRYHSVPKNRFYGGRRFFAATSDKVSATFNDQADAFLPDTTGSETSNVTEGYLTGIFLSPQNNQNSTKSNKMM